MGPQRANQTHWGVPQLHWKFVVSHLRKWDQHSHRFCGTVFPLHGHHNMSYGVSNHQPHDCLLNCLYRRRSKKTSKLHVTGLCVEIHRSPVNFPHKGPVTWKIFPFDDAIMLCRSITTNNPSSIVDFCARMRCLSQGQVITSQIYCVVWLLVPNLDTCFWHTNTPLEFTSPCTLILWANPSRMINQPSGSRVACSAISHYNWEVHLHVYLNQAE